MRRVQRPVRRAVEPLEGRDAHQQRAARLQHAPQLAQALLVARRRQLADDVEGRDEVERLVGERDGVDAGDGDAALAAVQAHLGGRLVEVEGGDAAVVLQRRDLAAGAAAGVQHLRARRGRGWR